MIVLGLLKNGRRSYNRYKRSPINNDQIFIILRSMGYNISITRTNELARDCRKILLEFLYKIENKGKRKLGRFIYRNQYRLDDFFRRGFN